MSAIRNDITKVKAINVDLIKSALRENPDSTKGQIAEATGVSVVTCGKILNELAGHGEVLEKRLPSDGCGRPAKSYRINASFALVACLFLWSDGGRLELITEIADLTGETVFSASSCPGEVNYETIEGAVASLLLREPRIRVVAIGVPGAVGGGTVRCSYLLALNGEPLYERLCAAFPGVTVILESDARAAAYGYCVSEPIGPDAITAYFFIPTHVRTGRSPDELLCASTRLPPGEQPLLIGTGVAIGGRILRGFSGFAGSLGLLARGLPPDGVCADALARMFETLVPVLNPSVIAVTGSGVTEDTLHAAAALCRTGIPAPCMPRFVLRPDCCGDYAHGLTLIALQEFSCKLELVQKTI